MGTTLQAVTPDFYPLLALAAGGGLFFGLLACLSLIVVIGRVLDLHKRATRLEGHAAAAKLAIDRLIETQGTGDVEPTP